LTEAKSVATTGSICDFPTRARVEARATLEQAEELRGCWRSWESGRVNKGKKGRNK
jgi:hypothetical protein